MITESEPEARKLGLQIISSSNTRGELETEDSSDHSDSLITTTQHHNNQHRGSGIEDHQEKQQDTSRLQTPLDTCSHQASDPVPSSSPSSPASSSCTSPKRGRSDNTCGLLFHAPSHQQERTSDRSLTSENNTNPYKKDSSQSFVTTTSKSLDISTLESKMSNVIPEPMEGVNDAMSEIKRLRDLLRQKDQEIAELKSHLDKFQAIFNFSGGSPAGILTSAATTATSIKKRTRTRLFGISAEPGPVDSVSGRPPEIPKAYPKDESTTSLLVTAIQSNDFMKHLDGNQINALTSCMYPVVFKSGSMVIREGDPGNVLYIIESGHLVVYNETVSGRRLSRGALFGELALLYNCTRTASVRVMSPEELAKDGINVENGDAHLWALERSAFQSAMVESGLQVRSQLMDFLRKVKLFNGWSEEMLSKVVDVSSRREYRPGDYIVRQGARGDTFFVIQEGGVRVTKNEAGAEVFIRRLGAGEFFGEKALRASTPTHPQSPSPPLTREEAAAAIRTANVIAEEESQRVACLVIERNAFNQLIGTSVSTFPEYDAKRVSLTPYERIKLEDLQKITTLGVGGFGRVELVTLAKNKEIPGTEGKSFALKVMKKRQIVETRQQTHILSEKQIMAECNSQFVVRLFATFKDKLNLYMLMEVCLGGELWTVLRDRGHFDEPMTRFYVGCVCAAFEYLHSRHIIYRDLKPENMLIDNEGYIKLTDFGFAKKLVPSGRKTWTFCGTPEYVAPEIILNRGHDYGADYWSLGVLMYELLTGAPPFTGPDPMKTYNIILKGIEAIEFPRFISKDASLLIKRLCRENPSERLGYMRGGMGEIKSNRWFDGFHWDGLEKRSMPAPYVPKIRGHLDSTNFDQYPADEPDYGIPDSPGDSGWDEDF